MTEREDITLSPSAKRAAILIFVRDEKKHKNEAELQLQILAETRPIKENIYKIKEDVGTIKTKLDILLDRYENNR